VSHVAHLVINNPGYFLGKNGERMVIREKRKTLYEIFLNRLESITLLSKATSISSDLVTHCAKIGIPLCWITSKGEVEAIILSPDSSTGELQIRQLEAARDPRQAFVLAKSFVVGKIKNQVHLIKYFGKYEKHRNGTFMDTYHRFENDTEKILTEAYDLEPSDDWPHTRGQLFSIEGRLASYYWDMFRLLLEGLVDFPGRERQGARDLVNCLLNYGYAVLRSRVLLELHRSGLNPYISFLHAGQKGIATLTFDVMEVFRPQVVDRVVLAELRKNSKRFKLDEEGRLIPESREHLVRQILDRLASIEKFRGRELKLEEIIREQVADLKKHFENKALYRPYMAKW
jgi:CRISPR-associated protein Cas1